MILIGLLLIVVAAGLAVWLVMGSQSLTTPVGLDTNGIHVSLTPLALLIAGAAIMVLLWLGVAIVRGSIRHRRRPAREAKQAQRQAEIEDNIRADERARAEEAHQSTLAERDRVHEEEVRARQEERDRTREADDRTRMDEAERRIRADERARVESELGTHAGTAPAGESSSRDGIGDATLTPAPPAERTKADQVTGRGGTAEQSRP